MAGRGALHLLTGAKRLLNHGLSLDVKLSSWAAFALGAAIRAIPEIVAGQAPIGFDTIYYAGVVSRLSACLDYGKFGDPSLLILTLCPFGKIIGPIMAVKLFGALLYGLLGLSFYHLSKWTLGLKGADAMFVVALTLLQVASLRISWDLYRSMLGLVGFILLLTYLDGGKNVRQLVAVVLLSALVALSDESVAALMVAVMLGLVIWDTLGRGTRRLRVLIPPILLGGISVLLIFPRTLEVVSFSAASVPPSFLQRAYPVSVFFAVLFLPLLLIAIFARRRIPSLLVWIAVILVGVLMSLLGSPYPGGFWDRWLLLLVFPLGCYAGLGALSVADRVGRFVAKSGRIGLSAVRAGLLLILLLPFGYVALGFMTSPWQQPFWLIRNPVLYRAGESGIPATMQSNTFPSSDLKDAQAAFQWLNIAMSGSDVLLVHPAFYGWALLYLQQDKNLIAYGDNGVPYGAQLAAQLGFKRAYLIWFAPGYPWHTPAPDVAGWTQEFLSGHIVIYEIALQPA